MHLVGNRQRHGRPARPRAHKAQARSEGRRRGRHTTLRRSRTPERRQELYHQRLHRRRPQHRDRDSRHHTRLYLHTLRQVRLRLLPRGHSRHTPQEQGVGRPGVLLSDALHSRHRELRCLHPHARRNTRHRGTGHEHLPAHTAQQQVARGGSEQVGPRGEQGSGSHQDLRERHPSAHGSVRRLPDHLRFGTHQAAHLQGARNSQGGVPQPQGARGHIEAQRGDAAAHRGIPTTINKGQVHQDKVLHAAA